MADARHITRRAAIVGAAAATTISPALAKVYRTGVTDTNTMLVELADRFKEDAKAIDPSIKGAWFGHDAKDGRLFFVHLDRGNDVPPQQSEIERLAREWMAVARTPWGEEHSDENPVLSARYSALQEQIISLEPTSIRDMAIQHFVDTDEYASCISAAFADRLKALLALS